MQSKAQSVSIKLRDLLPDSWWITKWNYNKTNYAAHTLTWSI